jgi:hypothetical protein
MKEKAKVEKVVATRKEMWIGWGVAEFMTRRTTTQFQSAPIMTLFSSCPQPINIHTMPENNLQNARETIDSE